VPASGRPGPWPDRRLGRRGAGGAGRRSAGSRGSRGSRRSRRGRRVGREGRRPGCRRGPLWGRPPPLEQPGAPRGHPRGGRGDPRGLRLAAPGPGVGSSRTDPPRGEPRRAADRLRRPARALGGRGAPSLRHQRRGRLRGGQGQDLRRRSRGRDRRVEAPGRAGARRGGIGGLLPVADRRRPRNGAGLAGGAHGLPRGAGPRPEPGSPPRPPAGSRPDLQPPGGPFGGGGDLPHRARPGPGRLGGGAPGGPGAQRAGDRAPQPRPAAGSGSGDREGALGRDAVGAREPRRGGGLPRLRRLDLVQRRSRCGRDLDPPGSRPAAALGARERWDRPLPLQPGRPAAVARGLRGGRGSPPPGSDPDREVRSPGGGVRLHRLGARRHGAGAGRPRLGQGPLRARAGSARGSLIDR